MVDHMNSKTFDITSIALMTAVTAVMAQIAIPMPAGVPMTLQTFAVTLAGVVLGSKNGGLSMVLYILMGAIGLPVFSGFRGGLAMLVGPTGGFLLSFPVMAFIIGLGIKYIKDKPLIFWSYLALGTIINYIIGTIVFSLSTGSGLVPSFMACVFPFIPTAVIKLIVGGLMGIRLRDAVPQLKH